MPPSHAEVVGGGIVGLGTAALLARAGWSVRVHERASEIREVGAAIGIRGGGAAVLRKLGIVDTLLAKTVVLTREERRDGNGRVLQSRAIDPSGGHLNPLRLDLVYALRDAAAEAGAEILTGSQVRRVWPDGRVVLEDGTELGADLVVVADGFRSRTRYLLGVEESVSIFHSGATRVLMPREGEPPSWIEYWSGRLRIGVAPAADDLTYVYLSCSESDAHASAVPIDAEYWSRMFPVLPRRFFERVEAAGGVRHLYPLVRCRTWAAGKVAVVGDAAHGLPSTLGLGASMALVNVYDLVQGLRGPVEPALRAWDARCRPSMTATQRWAGVYDAITVRCPPRLEGMRNGVVKALDVPWIHGLILRERALAIAEG